MEERTTQVTVFCTFETTIEIPLELQKDEEAIQAMIDEVAASEEILCNCTDLGESSRVTVGEWNTEAYEALEEQERLESEEN